MIKRSLATLFVGLLAMSVGCNSSNDGSGGTSGGSAAGETPTFTLAWSEYPSWSVFGVADEQGLIDGDEGALGSVEEKWNVDIVLHLRDYDTCIAEYGSNVADAVCITNMDIMTPAVSRPAVAVLPTSTSDGADACIAIGIDDVDALAGTPTRGLEKSVSQYCFERVLEQQGKDPADYPFVNMDPGAAAQAMQLGQEDMKSIMVWNPFVMQTLRTQPKSKVLFDSTSIPEEIIDMVVIGQDSLSKPGGQRFAYAVLEAFYGVNDLIAAEDTRDETLIALGANFSKLGLEDMQTVVEQTKFYSTPDQGLKLMEEKKFQEQTMPTVADFLISHEMAETKPSFGFNDPKAELNFDSQYLIGTRDSVSPDSLP